MQLKVFVQVFLQINLNKRGHSDIFIYYFCQPIKFQFKIEFKIQRNFFLSSRSVRILPLLYQENTKKRRFRSTQC